MLTTTCPHCKTRYDIDNDLADKCVECGKCGQKWSAVPDIIAESSRWDDDIITCPVCREKIKATALRCRFCGEELDGLGRSVALLKASKPSPEGKIKYQRETSCGMMCGEAIAILMIVGGLCSCITVIGIPSGIILILIGGALEALFTRIKTWYECSVCGEKLSTRNVKVCPHCNARLQRYSFWR